MKIFIRVVQLAVVVALGIWLWTVFFPGPEKIIRKQLNRLAATVSFSKNDGNFSKLAGLAGAANVADFFSTNVDVNVDLPGHEQHSFASRDEITQAVLLSRQQIDSLSVKFPDINVTVAADRQSALADVTVEATIPGESDLFIQELKISFVLSERHWLIAKVETVRTISQPNLG